MKVNIYLFGQIKTTIKQKSTFCSICRVIFSYEEDWLSIFSIQKSNSINVSFQNGHADSILFASVVIGLPGDVRDLYMW